MLTYIKARNINDAVYQSLDQLVQNGDRTTSRNSASMGDIYSIQNAFVEIENPRSRHLYLEGRKNNIFATIAETFWVFAGSNNIDPYLSFFLPRAKDFSDDGKTWRGGYPERIIEGDQINDVIQQFKNEGIHTRRAVLSIYDSNLDTTENLKYVYDLESTKDRPCNLIMDFFISPDKKLHMNVKSRSGDVIWGFGSINIFEWSFLQDLILQAIQRDIDEDVTIGSYNHHVTNLHMYESTGAQGFAVLDNVQETIPVNTDDIVFPEVGSTHGFFSDLVSALTIFIENEISAGYELDIKHIATIFDSYRVPTKGNLLYAYAILTVAYIYAKRTGATKEDKAELTVNLTGYSEEFMYSIRKAPFRKFHILDGGHIV